MADRLISATYKALSYGLWEDAKLTRLLDGTVTRHELVRAQKSVAEHAKLAEMTKRGAPDSAHVFDSVRVSLSRPRAYEVTVRGQSVQAKFANQTSFEQLTLNRSHARRAALEGVAVATELVGAIKDQLVLQSGARTALEELKDGAEDAAIAAGRQAKALARNVETAIAPGVKQAREALGTAERQVRTVTQNATQAVRRFIQR